MSSNSWLVRWGTTAKKVFYWGVLPAVTTVYLMLVSNIWPRPLLMDSKAADVLVRALLTAWYCGLSVTFSDPERYERITHVRRPSLSGEDSDCLTRIWRAGLNVMFLAVVAVITGGIVRTYLPGLSAYSTAIGVAYGLALAAPSVLRR